MSLNGSDGPDQVDADTTRDPAAVTEPATVEEFIDYPLVQEGGGAPPPSISSRLRDPRTIISIVLPIVILVLIFAAAPGFELDQLPGLISQANPWYLLAAVGIYYLGFPLRGYRWALLVRGAGDDLGVKDSTEIIFISWLVNCVVPAKLGDVYRAYLLRANFPVSLSKVFGTVFIERIFDLFAIVLLGFAAGFWSFRDGMSGPVKVVFAIGLVVIIVLAVGLFFVRNFGRKAMTRLPLPQRVTEFYDRFEEGVFSISPRAIPRLAFVTALIWATEAMRLYLVVQALHFNDVTLGISGAFFVALIASLLTAVPFTPAGLGIVELGIVGVLTRFYNVPTTEATAILVLDRTISVLSVILFGAIAWIVSSKTKARVEEVTSTGTVDGGGPDEARSGA
jgi:glycosyltransferase 2 family protein